MKTIASLYMKKEAMVLLRESSACISKTFRWQVLRNAIRWKEINAIGGTAKIVPKNIARATTISPENHKNIFDK